MRKCHTCQKNKSENVLTPGLFQPLLIPQTPFVDIGMDIIERLLNSKGRDVVLVVADTFSKYAHFITLSNLYTLATVVNAFMNNIYKLHGLPASIVSDRDPIFLRKFWKRLVRLLGSSIIIFYSLPSPNRQIDKNGKPVLGTILEVLYGL
jgi:hypothetical protein